MIKWEYLFVKERVGSPPTLEFLPKIKEPVATPALQDALDEMNKLGDGGWELCGAVGNQLDNPKTSATLIFKRPIPWI